MYSNKQPSSLFLYDKIDSTNLEAKRHASAYLEHPKVFIAKEQTSGRGRLNRETKKLQRSQEVLKKQQDRINGLKNKTGYCNLSSQILRTYTAAYSR